MTGKIIYLRRYVLGMGNSAQSGMYCIFCGSPNIKKINMEKKDSDTPRSFTAYFAGAGGGYSGGHSNSNTVILQTCFCTTCKMTDVEGTVEPGVLLLTDNNDYEVEVVLPGSLLKYFSSIKFQNNDIVVSIGSIEKRLKRIINKFEKTGSNPCINGKIGWKAKMSVGNIKVDVYVLVENKSGGRYIRIIYGGGRSFCT
jgi:hypothetical protein